jgi:hypothetical protein
MKVLDFSKDFEKSLKFWWGLRGWLSGVCGLGVTTSYAVSTDTLLWYTRYAQSGAIFSPEAAQVVRKVRHSGRR